ncbi:glycoside hydrolase family 3 protein [Pseudoalteromonas sp. Scap03]|uniref:glycoside hydrolase family 3 protein n=1 Tax=unclassified Pseudoalteromonas TaxID=194690 RepID=UPI0015BAB832|nr:MULTISPECIES: exo 1,3/1,4-beta-D-glucan glucohydrolase [unclassified Pseudoalteromonas]NWL15496.1 glycoside hydrolase family 3 protein [Pseudoalteromonas sp. Scap03]QLE80643.1 glycoside hydrolase family 3 protein [Pseudoalteromonas sp. Scap25]QLE88586.1 glycoside hydrolase family 3 protein [Pseudoalteromonas sp. Scap06]
MIIKRTFSITALMLAAITSSGCSQPSNSASDATSPKEIWPTIETGIKSDAQMEQKIADMLKSMTLEQKIAQMIQPEIRNITVEDMRKYGFGSYLNGGGSFPNNNKHATPEDWVDLAEKMYQASIDDSLDGSTIPTMWGTDAVHGHNNVIGATLFPHNIGLGAANNPALIEKIAAATAREVMVTGIDWVFAPTVAVVRDDRWGRTYEGYSEDPEIVKAYSASIVKGLQGAVDGDFLSDTRVVSTVKHFLGDGGTVNGDDQGNNIASEEELFALHAQGYVGGLSAGAQTVMASFNSWHGDKIHGNKYLLTDVLKEKMGFDGFVVGDWNGHGQVKGCSNSNCAQAANAGLDVYMAPDEWKLLFSNLVNQANSGEIPLSRINDAVTRILRVKMRAGLFDKPSPAKRPLSGKTEIIGSSDHRAVAKQAVRESLVLLKNKQQLLPLSPKTNVLVAGIGADNIGMQSGGWSVTWQGTGNTNIDFPGGSSIYAGIKDTVEQAGGSAALSVEGEYKARPDVAIVVFGEQPYAEGNGDVDNVEYQRGNKSDLALLRKFKDAGIPVVSLFISGRPMWVNAELNVSDAFVAIWLPGSEGDAISDVLFKNADGSINHDFKGKLSFSWPDNPVDNENRNDEGYSPLLPYGFGLTYGDSNVLKDDLVEQTQQTEQLDDLVLFERAIKAPWSLVLKSGEQQKTVASSRESLGAVSIQTFDKEVQEDARAIRFNGQALAEVNLAAAFPSDLRSYVENNGQLQMQIKVDKGATSPLWIAMGCGESCQGKFDITDNLEQSGQWQTLNINLSCFAEQGVDLAQVFSPWQLSTQGDWHVSIAKLAITANAAEQSSVTCK